jgi:catechol 2,3-dioxygenase
MSVGEAGSRYMIDSTARIGAVELIVADLARSERFYVDALGLQPIKSNDDRRVLAVAGTLEPLVILRQRLGTTLRPERTLGLYHFAILLPSRKDLARTLRRLAETGNRLQGAADHVVSEALYLSDPDGNGVEIYRDRPSGGWPWRDGEVVMDTLPIDFNNLLNELDGDSDTWAGLALGTRIGHIHLHVPELREATRFYVEVLGFQIVSRLPGAIFVSAGRYHHHIGLNTWAAHNSPPPTSAGLDHFEIRLPSALSLATVAERLTKFGSGLDEEYDGILARDPFGNRLSFASDR